MDTKEKTVMTEQEQPISDTNNDAVTRRKKIQIPNFCLQTKIILILALALILVVGILLAIPKNNSGQLTTISESSLQEILEIDELSTVDYTYNAIATKYDNKGDAMYYVAYEGIVTAGINFSEINIEVIEEDKKIIITIPEVAIHGTTVNINTLDFIFTKDKYETEDVTQEAYKLCIEDLKHRIDKENVLYTVAAENARSAVSGLFESWIDIIDNGYTVEIN